MGSDLLQSRRQTERGIHRQDIQWLNIDRLNLTQLNLKRLNIKWLNLERMDVKRLNIERLYTEWTKRWKRNGFLHIYINKTNHKK
jgi:hypothetical protein